MRTIGRYELVRKIGSGGMASVYLARQLDLDRLVALKELRALRTPDASYARRFLREARLAGSLNHPNIVTVHDYFEDGGVPYIAMEYLERGSLRRYMNRLTLARVASVLEGVLAGLAHAERHRIVHRDIKPENLLLTDEGGVKIADFGIAKATNALEQGTLVTAASMTVGTPNYMAPEQAMAGEIGPWTDLYAVGVTTFELLTGRTPFGDTEAPMAIVLRQINEPVPRVSDVAPQVPAWMSDWIAWLVSKDPAARPQSAGQAWDALEEALISMLGPRWRRKTAVPPGAEQPVQPVSNGADPRLAATVPPPRMEPAVVAGSARSGRRRRFFGMGPDVVEAPVRPRRRRRFFGMGPDVVEAPVRRRRRRRFFGMGPDVVEVRARGRRRRLRRWVKPDVVARRRTRRHRTPLRMVGVAMLLAVLALAYTSRPNGKGSPPGSSARNALTQPVRLGATTSTQRTPAPAPASSVKGGTLTSRVAPTNKLAGEYQNAADRLAKGSSGGTGSQATAAAALRDAAGAYRNAAAAAGHNDVAGYNTALTTAAADRARAVSALQDSGKGAAATTNVSTTSGTQTTPLQTTPTQTTPTQTTTGPAGGPCSGDSTSDDPSDDSCQP